MKVLPWVVLGVQLVACATTTHAQIRRDAAQRWGCAEGAIDIEAQGRDVLRASGCGKTLIYVCSGSQSVGDTHSTPVSEEEARFHGNNAGECHPR